MQFKYTNYSLSKLKNYFRESHKSFIVLYVMDKKSGKKVTSFVPVDGKSCRINMLLVISEKLHSYLNQNSSNQNIQMKINQLFTVKNVFNEHSTIPKHFN